MTVAAPGKGEGILEKVIVETAREDGENEVTLLRSGGTLAANLQLGADLTSCLSLASNQNLSSRGMMLFGSGFIIDQTTASSLGYGRILGIENHIRGYRNGRDLTDKPREVLVIDLFGTTPDTVQSTYPALYQHVLIHVKPERDQNRDKQIRDNWWLHGRSRPELRDYIFGLSRYITTVETSKHRFFTFLDQSILPDNKLIAIASDDAYVLGILSSSVHVTWSLAIGARLEDRPVYVKTTCFEPFPFPLLEEGPTQASHPLPRRAARCPPQAPAGRNRMAILPPPIRPRDRSVATPYCSPAPSKPPSLAPIQTLPLQIKNPKSTIINRQSIPLPAPPGLKGCQTKSPSSASSLAQATRVSPLLMMQNRSPRSSVGRTRNAPNRSRGFWRR